MTNVIIKILISFIFLCFLLTYLTSFVLEVNIIFKKISPKGI